MTRGLSLALCLLTLTGCAKGGSGAARHPPPEVAAGPASMYSAIRVSAGGRSADVPASLQSQVAPLLAARSLPGPRSAADYGLDRPQARLTYLLRDGRANEVLIGNPNFDRHFVYAQRALSLPVFLVPADTLRPVLALVGVELLPPD